MSDIYQICTTFILRNTIRSSCCWLTWRPVQVIPAGIYRVRTSAPAGLARSRRIKTRREGIGPPGNVEIGEGRSPCQRPRRLSQKLARTIAVSDDREASLRLPRSCCTCGLAMLAKPRFLRTGTSRTGQKSKSRLNSKGLIAGRRIRSDDFSLASLTAFKECVCGCRRTVCLGSIRSLRDGPV